MIISSEYLSNEYLHLNSCGIEFLCDKDYSTLRKNGRVDYHILYIAKGKYVKVLSADDVLTEDGLSILVDYMENNQGKDFAFGNVEYVDKNSKDLNVNHFSHRRNVIHCNYRS